MAKKNAGGAAGAAKNNAKKGKAEVGKAGKAASGKKPEKKDASGKGAVKKEEEKKTKKVAVKQEQVKPAAKKAVAKPAAKAGESKPAGKKPAAKPEKKPAAKKPAAKKPVRPLPDEEELKPGDVVEEPAEDEEPKDLDDDDLDIDPALAAVAAEDEDVEAPDDIIDVDPESDAEEILPGVDLDADVEGEQGAFGDKKEGGLVRKAATGKKPKIIVVAATGPKKLLKLAPGLLKNAASKAPVSSSPAACPSSGEEDKKKEYRKLTKKEMLQIKDKLIVMREDILEKMRKELADTRQRAGTAPADLIDQASDAYDDDVSFEIASANDEDLEQIEAALERLAEGTYGLCEICNVPISPARLKILPFATRCVSCRGDFEKSRSRRDSAGWNFFSEGENADADESHEEEEE